MARLVRDRCQAGFPCLGVGDPTPKPWPRGEQWQRGGLEGLRPIRDGVQRGGDQTCTGRKVETALHTCVDHPSSHWPHQKVTGHTSGWGGRPPQEVGGRSDPPPTHQDGDVPPCPHIDS